MGFKCLLHEQWPCEATREFVVILQPRATLEGVQQLIDEMSEALLGTTDVPVCETFADILVAAGLFPSKGQANKAGANTADIPDGLSVFCIGKLRTFVWVWKPIKSEDFK